MMTTQQHFPSPLPFCFDIAIPICITNEAATYFDIVAPVSAPRTGGAANSRGVNTGAGEKSTSFFCLRCL